jgi:glyoxylase-like metal-dependent hydrolase (beta-lactamase superfamily II)
MAPLDTQEIVDGIYVIKGDSYVDFYVIKNGDSLIAIDSGENQNEVSRELNKLNLNPSAVKAVFLTHTDSDHAGGLRLFSAAKVYISSAEEQMINGKTPGYFLLVKNTIPAQFSLLLDNQDIEVSGIRVHCVLTPGHTPGSMSYVINDGYIFSGDTLSLENDEVHVFNEFFNMDTKLEKSSITKLSELIDIRYIFTAHYGYTDNYQTAFARWSGN